MPKIKSIGTVLTPVRTSLVSCLPKQVNEHYGTVEHRAWAQQVIARAGGRCQYPGCEATRHDGRLYADHIVEIEDGGAPLDPANGQALCAKHHSIKTARNRAKRHQSTEHRGGSNPSSK